MSRSDEPPNLRSAGDVMTITAALGDHELDVEVPRLDHGRARADAVLAAVAARIPGIDRVPLVVERTGTPAWGAAAGGDLLCGDRLVVVEERRLPLLVGTAGPALGVVVPIVDGIHLAGDGTPTASSSAGAVLVEPTVGGLRSVATGPAPVSVNGADAANGARLHAGDLVNIGPSTLVVVADRPPQPGQLTEHGSVYVRAEPVPPTTPIDPAAIPLGRVLASAVARDRLLWSVPAAHPQHLGVAVGPTAVRIPEPGRPLVVTGPAEAAVEFLAACVLRLVVLHGPDVVSVRFATLPGSPLDDLAHRCRFLPHRRTDEPDRRPVVEVADGAAVVADDDPPRRLLLVGSAADAPVGAVDVVDVTGGAPERLPLAAVDPVTRLLAPLVAIPVGDGDT